MKRAFTLVELLVIVTIIVVLIAMLAPALEKSQRAGRIAKCMANVRNTAQACLTYGLENRGLLPVYQMFGKLGSSYDLRATWDAVATDPKIPMGIGQLVSAGFLPATQLGKIIHCPMFDNSAHTTVGYRGHGMDVGNHGGSGWVVDPNLRIYCSYNYRAPSYYNAGGGNLRMSKVGGSGFLLYVDVPDLRFRGLKGVYSHSEGYSRAFADGAALFLSDPSFRIDQKIMVERPNEGIMHGIEAGPGSQAEERVYEQMEHEQED